MTKLTNPSSGFARFTRSTITLILGCLALAVAVPAQETTRYWPTSGAHTARIDGYGFDFDARGGIDGPFSHNGRYRVIANAAGRLKMALHFGTDRRQKNDMDVSLEIKNGTATVRGKVKGKDIGAVRTRVRRRGKFFTLEFRVRSKGRRPQVTTHTIRWAAPASS